MKSRGSSAITRVVKYTLVRAVTLFATVIASVFIIIYIANLGGYLDTIQKAEIDESINGMLEAGWLRGDPPDQRQQAIDDVRASMQTAYGLDQPYVLRVADWLKRGITLNWGKSRFIYPISSTYVQGTHSQSLDVLTNDIRTAILSYLPRTLLLLGTSNLLLFLSRLLMALWLNRKPGSWLGRLFTALAPTSAAPSWMFGLIFIIFITRVLGNYSFRLGFNAWRTNLDLSVIAAVFQGLFLPFLAIFLSKFFQSIYSWRVYFSNYTNEDYIELARAKGLSPGMLERRYLLRPALPSIITSFALIMISIWQECIAVEYFFDVGGIGSFFVTALQGAEIGIIVALVSLFAYFLAITVFILDIAYAVIDPRIKVQSEAQRERPYRAKSGFKILLNILRGRRFSNKPLQAELRPVRAKRLNGKIHSFVERINSFWNQVRATAQSLLAWARDLSRYPSAWIGMGIILILIVVSIGTVIVFPYSKVIRLWRGDDKAWIHNPVEVPPAWTNLFRREKLPENIQLGTQDKQVNKQISVDADGNTTVSIAFPFDYEYGSLPQDIMVLFNPIYDVIQPFVSMSWVTPDGREIPLKNFAISREMKYLISGDSQFVQKNQDNQPLRVLLGKPGSTSREVLKGNYTLKIKGLLFESNSKLDAEFVVFGQVYGLAGTDNQRRDLLLVLLWGIVAALSFGILAALATTFGSVTLAAAGAWFGGWVDGLIQRISEINMVLPILPTSILIFYLYSKSFWVILGVTVGLSIFGNSVKNYRAMFLQLKQLPYIEAASTYGASGWRIIFQYLIPRVRSVLIPQLIILIPSYIFFESTLSFLGVSDPFLPTLGKLLVTSLKGGLTGRPFYLLVEPVVMLSVIALGFALFGFALERLFNEKLGV